jgi:DNA-binding MarR family transcriptional regulator
MREQVGPSPAAERLATAFMRFRKSMWHPRSVAGRTLGEVHMLLVIQHGVRHGKPDAHGASVSEISRILRVTSPSVTQMTKSLESDGLVERTADPTDRRAVCLQLTPSGLVVARLAEQEFQESFRGLADYLGEEQSDQLATLLNRVRHYFNERAGAIPEEELEGEMVP